MRTLRATLNRWLLVAAVVWSLAILFVETFKGSSVGGPACYADPTCGEVGGIPTAFWIGGLLAIFLVGIAYEALHRPEPTAENPAIPLSDRIVAVAVVITLLVLAGVAFTLYQDNRATALGGSGFPTASGAHKVDGIPLGSAVQADAQFEGFARTLLDKLVPGHAAVTEVRLYDPDFRDAHGGQILDMRGDGRALVAVLHLAKGPDRAFYVACGFLFDPQKCFEQAKPAGAV